MELLHNSVFLLLLIICLGEIIGKIELFSFSFGSSAIIFVALAFGHLGYQLPPAFQMLGLILFIYSVALMAGPGFFSSFRKHGLHLALGALCVVTVGAICAFACAAFFHFDAGITAGLFAGALTSTPGLAVAVESVRESQAPAAYGLTYCFGVIGVILFVNLLPRVCRINIHQEEKELAEEVSEDAPPIQVQHIELTNTNLFGKKIGQLSIQKIAPVVITRLLRRDSSEPLLVSAETTLEEGDHLRLVGREADLQKVEPFLGRPIEAEIEFNNALAKKRITVSKTEAAGQTIGSFNLKTAFNVQATRITRNGIELPVTSYTRLRIGDVLCVVGDEKSIENIIKVLGNNKKATYKANMLSLLLGLCVGLAIGKVTIPLPLLGNLSLGTTGGVLVAGLLLSNLYKTGPVIWEVPDNINQFIRDLGLVIFLATVGTKTGATIMETLAAQGINLFLSGIVVTLCPMIIASFVCRRVFSIKMLRIIGVLTGGMTSTPGLASASAISETTYASSAYATVYPVALISMIIFTKLLIFLVGLL